MLSLFISTLATSIPPIALAEIQICLSFSERILNVKEKSFPYYNYNIYEHFSHDCWNSINDNSEKWPHTLYVCTPASSKSEEFAESVCIMCYMNLKDVKEWENTYNTTIDPSERNAAYLQFKKDKEEQIIKRLETRYPDFRSCIKNVYSSTPLTYRDYIGTPEGSLYGIKKDYKNPIGTTINSKTRIPNLYLTGQNTTHIIYTYASLYPKNIYI